VSLSAPPQGGEHQAEPPLASLEPEALIEEAWHRTRRRRRRWALTALAVVVVFGAIGVGIVRAQPSQGGAAGGRAARRGAAGAAGSTGAFWYTRTITASRGPLPVVPRVMPVGEKPGPVPLVYFDVGTSSETWIGRDGTVRQRTVVLTRRFASPADRRRWVAAHQTLPGGSDGSDQISAGDDLFPATANAPSSEPGDPGDGLFSYRQLLGLPPAPGPLAVRLERAESALNLRELNTYVRPGPAHRRTVARLARQWTRDQDQLYTITGLIESPVPDRVRLALVAAAARLPGVSLVPDPPAGKIVLTETADGSRQSLAVDAATGELRLAGQTFAGDTSVVAAGPTSSVWALPRGVTAIAPKADVLPPTGVTVTPVSGDAGTSFAVAIPVPRSARASGTAPFLEALLFGPTGPDCTFWSSQVPSAAVTGGQLMTAGGRSSYEYRLTASAVHHASWCAGRYQLEVTPVSLGRRGSQDLAGPSATYFTVDR
jgi:hypothetical protein